MSEELRPHQRHFVREEQSIAPATASIRLVARLLGPIDVRVDGALILPLRSRREEWLLALFLLRGDSPLSREWLAATIWPDSDGPQALYNLRRALTDLRRALGSVAQCLHAPDHRTIRLNLANAFVDVVAFDAAIRQGDALSLRTAVDLYQGVFLEGCHESWVLVERSRREEEFLQALERLAALEIARGDYPAALTFLRRVLATKPERETALRTLLETLIAIGDGGSAVAAYREFRLYLHTTLNTLPSEETRLLYERLKASSVDVSAVTLGAVSPLRTVPLNRSESTRGAVPLSSLSYIEREADPRFHEAIARGDSIVLLKGPRQVGKTSLLARGLARARHAGCRVVTTDLQKLDPEQMASAGTLLLALARQLAERLELEVTPEEVTARWNPQNSPNENFERFLRRCVLGSSSVPFVWGIDEVDRLFTCPYSNEVFGLLRSWHNERALDPDGPWGQLTLAMAYATEAYLFIADLNQSPFNVGTRLTLADFTEEEVERLNHFYGRPLTNLPALRRFTRLMGGHPYLVRRGLQEITESVPGFAPGNAGTFPHSHVSAALEKLESVSVSDDGPFGDHLRRLVLALRSDQNLSYAVREILSGRPCPGDDLFYRLRSAGIITGDAPETARLRCGLYARYLERRLP